MSREVLWQGRFAVWTVKNKVETSFDESEFLEGAKDAWVAGLCSRLLMDLGLHRSFAWRVHKSHNQNLLHMHACSKECSCCVDDKTVGCQHTSVL